MALKRIWLVVGAPLVSVATLMIGLRIGAGESVHSATISAAPPGKPGPDGKTRVAWQLATSLDERMVKEMIAVPGLTVVARTKTEEARWSGRTNDDGIAEVNLAFASLTPGDDVELDVRADGDAVPLAKGHVTWSAPSWGGQHEGAVRPTSRSGAIGLDVLFAEPSSREADASLSAVMGPDVVLSAVDETIVMEQGVQVSRVLPLPDLMSHGAAFGLTNVELDGDASLRRMPPSGESFVGRLLAVAGDRVVAADHLSAD